MRGVQAALESAAELHHHYIGDDGYALAYGSHASGTSKRQSDLDLLFVGELCGGRTLDELVDDVVALHRRHGFDLDTEVSYESKLVVSRSDIDAALDLDGFVTDADGKRAIVPVVVEPWFLNSAAFKLRLVLNALTTPHVFLGGDPAAYRAHCARAARAVGLLAMTLFTDRPRFTISDAVSALVTADNGATGEDFLGYTRTSAFYSTVSCGLAALATDDVIQRVSATSYTAHRAPQPASAQRGCTDYGPPAGTWDNGAQGE